jgi:transcriptional regulator with PAS, ATPase and Fis domain
MCAVRLSDAEAIQIRAVLALERHGFSEPEICRALKISRRTLYRRLAKAEALKREHRPTMAAVAVAC